jgi:predicted MPP superfamily phosphohydrolase
VAGICQVFLPETGVDIVSVLEQRLGRLHARQRLGIERDHEAQVFGQGLNFFHFENLTSMPGMIRAVLRLGGLYGRGQRNAAKVVVRTNPVASPLIPGPFDGFRLLHLSDLHVDMSGAAMNRLLGLLDDVAYDVCVLTGDYRGLTFGDYQPSIEGMARICARLRPPTYGVLGNHDTILMVPAFEAMGMRLLLNEREVLERGGARIHLAGIDDAHFYRVDNIEKAAEGIPPDEFSILLSHTPEIYRQAANADFNLLLCGHTHGGQICLPGGIPITLDSSLPRRYGAGSWAYRDMIGYTSVGAGTSVSPVRFNCAPEITLHVLKSAAPSDQ